MTTMMMRLAAAPPVSSRLIPFAALLTSCRRCLLPPIDCAVLRCVPMRCHTYTSVALRSLDDVVSCLQCAASKGGRQPVVRSVARPSIANGNSNVVAHHGESMAAAQSPEPKPLHRRWTMASVEQLVSREVDRSRRRDPAVRRAERHGTDSTSQGPPRAVTSQVPEGAVGYRLVLPSRTIGDGIRPSPRTQSIARGRLATLSPLEYPDDLRLRDGH